MVTWWKGTQHFVCCCCVYVVVVVDLVVVVGYSSEPEWLDTLLNLYGYHVRKCKNVENVALMKSVLGYLVLFFFLQCFIFSSDMFH